MELSNEVRRLFRRFLFRLAIPEDRDACWTWLANPARRYGAFRIGKRQLSAHQAAWFLWNGHIPEAKVIMHECDNTKCVNPRHLFLGSPADNIADKVAKGRQARGVQMYASKLTEQQVLEIRASKETYRHMSQRYGVAISTLLRIRKRLNWKHI